MSAAELFEEVTGQGISLAANNGKIKYRSSEPIPLEIIVKLKQHKQEILQLLEKENVNSSDVNKGWLDDHSDELKAAGYTSNDINGSRYVKGVADLLLWNEPDLTVELRGNVLVFNWGNATGQQREQTCPPERKAGSRFGLS